MAVFNYKALGAGGAVVTGELTAGDRGEALRQLDKKGLQPVKVSEAKVVAKPSKVDKTSARRKPSVKARPEGLVKASPKAKAKDKNTEVPEGPIKMKSKEVVYFTEELSDMLAAGLQLEPALRAMEDREEDGTIKVVSERIRTLVRDGTSFSQALKRVSPSFGPLYCSLAAAGEASGALDTILRRQAHYLKTIQELKGRITLALIYPSFLILSGIGVSVIFVTKLIPQLTGLLKGTPGSEMPIGVRVMIGASDFARQWWLVALLVLVAAAIFFKAWKDAERNRPAWDRIKLKLPLYGNVVRGRFYVQFLETMANLVANGLPLLRSLELTRDAAQNIHLRSSMDEMIEMVGDGRSLSSAMIRSQIFPPLLIDMVAVGEQTGKIDLALRRAAERFDKELDAALQKVMAMVMPAVLLLMASLVGTMAYAMISAIFQTINNLGGV
ncbi:type II secretion system F family protein [Roseibacillus ishigakijimensis]|uniref:Type II secretion system F family protein n=1 Tax=Roseibacillus ishigakijimensis TaxID=454146 RepID=A0A934RMW2_9BACT|nr:type II secretion system F family protein [Roseibacillus ishigakijimensis]MBK1832587.1 type II secretion system F family protein [Roseibacillus ishigakijimensis]